MRLTLQKRTRNAPVERWNGMVERSITYTSGKLTKSVPPYRLYHAFLMSARVSRLFPIKGERAVQVERWNGMGIARGSIAARRITP